MKLHIYLTVKARMSERMCCEEYAIFFANLKLKIDKYFLMQSFSRSSRWGISANLNNIFELILSQTLVKAMFTPTQGTYVVDKWLMVTVHTHGHPIS